MRELHRTALEPAASPVLKVGASQSTKDVGSNLLQRSRVLECDSGTACDVRVCMRSGGVSCVIKSRAGG